MTQPSALLLFGFAGNIETYLLLGLGGSAVPVTVRTNKHNPQGIELSAWETILLTVTMVRDGDITGQTFQLNIRDESKATVLILNSVTDSSQFALVDTGSSETPGIFEFTLTSEQSGNLLKQATDYKYDIWRVDVGAEERLCWGSMSNLEEQWK